jgi:putative Holliday junction resolvase
MDYLGIDYGSKCIGLAWGSDDLKVVVPLKALRVYSMEQVLRDLRKIVSEKRCDAFVIGLPIHADGTEGQRVKEVKFFAELLKQHFNLKIYFQDERFSTQTARTLTGTDSLSLHQAKVKKEKGVIDSTAAAVILEEWIVSKQRILKDPL